MRAVVGARYRRGRRALPRARAKHVPGTMNKTEARYAAEVLERRRVAGEVLWFEFEPAKLRIGHRCWYEADFAVLLADRTFEFHEVKAWWSKSRRAGVEDDARVKLQAAARLFPFFAFRIAAEERARGSTVEWHMEEIQAVGAAL